MTMSLDNETMPPQSGSITSKMCSYSSSSSSSSSRSLVVRNNRLLLSLLFLQTSLQSINQVDATTVLCNTPQECIFPQDLSCADLIATNTFYGTCCSLADNTALNDGTCVVTISNGHCIWESTSAEGLGQQGIQYLSESQQPCPPSDYDPFANESSPTPAIAPDEESIPSPPPPQSNPIAPSPPPSPLPTDPPVNNPLPLPTDLPTVAVVEPTSEPTSRPTVESLNKICSQEGEGPCEIILKQPCPDFVAANNFVGSCCSLEHIAETGECIVSISNGHCLWEPKDGSCNPLYGKCGEYGGILYTSLSKDECPPSGFDVFGGGQSILQEEKEEKTRVLTIVWVSILIVVIFVRMIICIAKIYVDRINMQDEEDDEDYDYDDDDEENKSSSVGTTIGSLTPPPRLRRRTVDSDCDKTASSSRNDIELVDQTHEDYVLNQHSAYFDKALSGIETDKYDGSIDQRRENLEHSPELSMNAEIT